MKMFSTMVAAVAGAFVFVAAASAQPAPLSADDQAMVAKAAAYLDGLTSAEGRFVQTDARGVTTQGSFYLKRPGKIRFEYDPPATMLVVSDGHNVTVYDQRLKTFNAYPLNFTPLHVFLARNIRLDRGVSVDEVEHTAQGFSVTAHAGSRGGEGSITLEFADNPMRLAAWTIVDARGARTRVALTSIKPASGLSAKLFVITGHEAAPGQ